MANKSNLIKKYPVGSDVDKEIIFNFCYLLNKETVDYIENNAQVMFIMRGPPSTGKATLSEMLKDKYPSAVYCCADKYFSESFGNIERNRESLKASHTYCQKKVENACKNAAQTIIVQNTHMRKWEMQAYLDFAAQYNYTVVMAITLYRFDCTPQALAENNTDGLDIDYFRKRLAQWHDVIPMFTGWFVSPNDSLHILHHLKESLESLLEDGKFCRIFNTFETDDLLNYFKPRKMLCCPAGYLKCNYAMKNYYLSDEVQSTYGKCFTITVLGYLVTTNYVIGIVEIDLDMAPLVSYDEPSRECNGFDSINTAISHVNLSPNLHQFSKTQSFPKRENLPNTSTARFEEQQQTDKESGATYGFMEIAQKDFNKIDIASTQREFLNSLKYIKSVFDSEDLEGCIELESEDDSAIYRLDNETWIIKPTKKLLVKSLFTGLYL